MEPLFLGGVGKDRRTFVRPERYWSIMKATGEDNVRQLVGQGNGFTALLPAVEVDSANGDRSWHTWI